MIKIMYKMFFSDNSFDTDEETLDRNIDYYNNIDDFLNEIVLITFLKKYIYKVFSGFS